MNLHKVAHLDEWCLVIFCLLMPYKYGTVSPPKSFELMIIGLQHRYPPASLDFFFFVSTPERWAKYFYTARCWSEEGREKGEYMWNGGGGGQRRRKGVSSGNIHYRSTVTLMNVPLHLTVQHIYWLRRFHIQLLGSCQRWSEGNQLAWMWRYLPES